MGRQDVFELLKKNKTKWLDCKDIRDLTGLNVNSVSRSLRNMVKANDPIKVKKAESRGSSGIRFNRKVYKYEDAIDKLMK